VIAEFQNDENKDHSRKRERSSGETNKGRTTAEERKVRWINQ